MDWGLPFNFQMLLYIPLLQHLPLCFNYRFKSLVSTMGCESLKGRDHALFVILVLRTGPGTEQVFNASLMNE